MLVLCLIYISGSLDIFNFGLMSLFGQMSCVVFYVYTFEEESYGLRL